MIRATACTLRKVRKSMFQHQLRELLPRKKKPARNPESTGIELRQLLKPGSAGLKSRGTSLRQLKERFRKLLLPTPARKLRTSLPAGRIPIPGSWHREIIPPRHRQQPCCPAGSQRSCPPKISRNTNSFIRNLTGHRGFPTPTPAGRRLMPDA